ncbi:PAS domain-containing protein [bacterium]|nr:PAS domain-containing protein [bacterium]
MSVDKKPHRRSTNVGPVSLVRWKESEGREILESSGDLARQLRALGIEHLDEVLGVEDREKLEDAIFDLARDCGSSDLGPVKLLLAEGEPAWFHLTALASEPQGQQGQMAASFVDISGLIDSQRALEAKSAQLEFVIEGTRLGIWDWNPQSGDVCFNEQWAQMLGYSLSEIESRLDEWESRVHPDDLAPCYEAIKAHLEGETPFYENVHRMRHRDGHWVHILDRGRVMERDTDGQPIRFTGTHTDVSPQREAELAAQAASKIKSEFLATMSHEIRTPLCGMMGLVEVLESAGLSPEQREHTELIKRCGEHLRVVLDEVLELTRLESKSVELNEEAFDVNVLFQDLHNLFLGEANSKGIELRQASRTEGPALLVGDRHRLLQVFSNLLANAIKFTDAGYVQLDFRLEESPLRLHASVEDTGMGIRNPERIWDGFQQEDATIAATYGGSGLGLTITQELIHLMGGTIGAQSAAGKGSCFELTVPIQRAEEAPSKALAPGAPAPGGAADSDPSATASSSASVPTLRVLVADDNTVNQRILAHFLKALGADFELVEDGQEAIEAASRRTFDLVLLDLQMPKRCGLSAAKKLRSLSSSASARIVAVTADVFNSLRLAEEETPFDAIVTKPFSLGDIREQVLAAAASLR